jgi:hypothetical protein
MIKVGFLVSYDFKYLYQSIPLVYKEADLIVLAIDRERKPEWQPLYIALEFLNGYANLMFRTKLFYTKIPYIPENTPAQNDTRERNFTNHGKRRLAHSN